MKTRNIHLAVLMAATLGVSQVHAAEGYWDDKASDVWRSGAGECVHTGFWNTELATVIGCDGKEAAPPAPEPVAEVVPVAPEPVAMTAAEETVNFAFDRSDLDGTATAKIDSLVSKAKSQGSIKAVRLTGHTDRVGTDEYNTDLSLRRATSVSDYLVERSGVDAQSIEISGKGESEPLVGCEGVRGAAALECLAPNRRVEIVVDLF